MITPTTSTDFGAATRPSTTLPSDVAYTGDPPFSRISWSSIFAGAVIALAIQLVFTLIGAAIGLATLDPATGDNPSPTAIGFGAGMWLIVTSAVSLLAGGYIAARLGGTLNGWLHGLITWAVVTMLTMILLSTAAAGLVGAASGLANFVANNDTVSAVELRRETRQAADRNVARAQDAQAAQAAADSGAAGTGAAALALIVGAVAAALGGKRGQRRLGRRDSLSSDDTMSTAAIRR